MALTAIARAVDQDAEFRARVVAAVDAEAVGRAGWLWLARPPGWADDLAAVEADDATHQAARAAEQREARDERTAARRLVAAHAAAERAERLADERHAEIARLQADLAEEHDRRAELDAQVAQLASVVAELGEARATAVRNLKEAEARLVRRATEVNALRARLRDVEATHPAPPVGTDGGEAARGGASGPRGEEAAVLDSRLAAELDRVARVAASLADGLTGLAARCAPTVDRPLSSEATIGPEPAAQGAPSARRAPAVPSTGRVPVALPAGILDDSTAAAEHLLRTPGAVLVVDGYNVTMTGWPDHGAAEQRRRLVTALADHAARTSMRVEVVFDGAEAEVGAVPVPTPARQLVRVRFSPPGVEADDVVLDLVAQLPASRPVVVVSSDNRVRQGARSGGANLLYSRQLLDALRIGGR